MRLPPLSLLFESAFPAAFVLASTDEGSENQQRHVEGGGTLPWLSSALFVWNGSPNRLLPNGFSNRNRNLNAKSFEVVRGQGLKWSEDRGGALNSYIKPWVNLPVGLNVVNKNCRPATMHHQGLEHTHCDDRSTTASLLQRALDYSSLWLSFFFVTWCPKSMSLSCDVYSNLFSK
jgi:hypothetical protein